MSKCILLLGEYESIETGEGTIYSVEEAKYLGTYIGPNGETITELKPNEFGRIINMLKTNKKLSVLSKIKLFKLYCKGKINHILPTISLSKGLGQIWVNIRKTIFRDVIEFSIIPKEVMAIFKLSYLNYLFKPLLKTAEKTLLYSKNQNNQEMKEYFGNGVKNALTVWLKYEDNLSIEVKGMIDDVIGNKKCYISEDFSDAVYRGLASRLTRGIISRCHVI